MDDNLSEEQEKILSYCKSCLPLDPVKQEDFVNKCRTNFKEGLERMFHIGELTKEELEEFLTNCETCYLAKYKKSKLREQLYNTFENLGIQDPWKDNEDK